MNGFVHPVHLCFFPSGMPDKLAPGKRPKLPGITLASSLIMSPKREKIAGMITLIPFIARGFLTVNMSAERINLCADT